jgi:DNA-directed RNA polymerase specialized sigma24 family protein
LDDVDLIAPDLASMRSAGLSSRDNLALALDLNLINELAKAHDEVRAVVAIDYQRMTAKEVADIAGISPHAVRRMRLRGKRIIREQMGAAGRASSATSLSR